MPTQSKAKPAARHGGRRGGMCAPEPHAYSSTKAAGCQPIFAQGKAVGVVRGATFVKRVRASIHQLRKPPAWALDAQSLADAERAGAVRVQICDSENDTTYTASIADIRRRGFTVNRGYGLQIALPLELWAVTRPGEPVARQLALLGV